MCVCVCVCYSIHSLANSYINDGWVRQSAYSRAPTIPLVVGDYFVLAPARGLPGKQMRGQIQKLVDKNARALLCNTLCFF